MINNKEDLYNTCIKNDNGELLRLYVEKCLSFGFVLSPAFSGKKLLDESFNYAVLGIDGDCVWAVSMNHREMKRELTLDDLTPQTNIEAPEEKEVEWKSGDKCIYMSDEFLFVGMIPTLDDFSCVIFSDTHGAIRATTADISKPKTKQQREEREKLEAAYDLYCVWVGDRVGHHAIDFSEWKIIPDYYKKWLRIVDKTNYRKEG